MYISHTAKATCCWRDLVTSAGSQCRHHQIRTVFFTEMVLACSGQEPSCECWQCTL